MGFDVSVRPEQTSTNEDRRWIAARKGFDTCRSVMLDWSLFTADHTSVKGALPSGTALGEVGTTGVYGPYDLDAVNGLETCAGFLFTTTMYDVDGYTLATAPDQGIALFWEGIVNQDYLPVPAGGETDGVIDAAARADLVNSIRFEGTDL
jgi:hypothetical protein